MSTETAEQTTPETVAATIIDEPENEYAKAQQTIFEQIVGRRDNDDPTDIYFRAYVPKSETAEIRRMANKGWDIDPSVKPVLGEEDYLHLRLLKTKWQDDADRSVRKIHETQGDEIKQIRNTADDADPETTTTVVNGYKNAQEILDKLPETVDDEDES